MTRIRGIEEERNGQEWKLWYQKPASVWEEALPIGNGRLGGMVFGGTDVERLALNEDTLWAGFPRDGMNYEARRHLAEARKLIFDGRNAEAQRLIEAKMLGRDCEPYLPLGTLTLDWGRVSGNAEAIRDYRRALTLDDGIATVVYRTGDISLRGEYFASAPDQAIFVRYFAEEGSLDVDLGFESPLRHTVEADGDTLILKGRAPSHISDNYRGDHPASVLYETGLGLPYEARVLIDTDGLVHATKNGKLEIRKAKMLTIYVAAATGFTGYDATPDEEGISERCRKLLSAASVTGYERARSRHLQDHRQLFRRVDLRLEGDAEISEAAVRVEEKPTDERLNAYRQTKKDPALEALYFQYGRYLLMASSRPGTQPANLQGIWNPHVQPPWNSDYTVNINTQMNYWPAEVANLSECHDPLFDMLQDLSNSGRRTAEIHYGCRGWTTHHNVDLWRMSTPTGGSACWAFWPLGGAWLVRHLWDRYLFSLDVSFLRERAFPIMKGAALFCLDWLTVLPDGTLVTNPSTSPENAFLLANGESCNVTVASTMDIAIIRELFTNTLEAIRAIGGEEEDALRDELSEAIVKLPDCRIGRHGQIQEWLEDYEEAEPGHRHISHLYGLHPGVQIHDETPELLRAAAVTLERRLAHGGGHTGWSCAWLINQFARLKDSSQAHVMVQTLLANSTYPNLFDAHPPFQIDGNFGGTAGISEMLLQSHHNRIELLPALPMAWRSGWISGLKARGGFSINLSWKDGRLTEAAVTSAHGANCRIKYAYGEWCVKNEQGADVAVSPEGDFETSASSRYFIRVTR
ncbi:glycoside hydrolase family 95 protein [Cohnella endophytica]|uniref:Glycoside hydrolase family 95 protein n=1 Tax=Cohnella endophytica TaxID=2419778 RepID=A0A494Y8K5_9BACL|nr:glycoside hydrolase family 95 protein [Cohnella endophytica]RKP56973.1 glycoside hydrolase family 95 protein [Cohnella endophytica]